MDEMTAATSLTRALAGLVTVILAVLGLTGRSPADFAAVGLMMVGAAAVLEGASTVARAYGVGRAMTMPGASGLTAEALAGVAAVALGALAVLRVSHALLLPIAAIVLGIGVVLTGASTRATTIRETFRNVTATQLFLGLAVSVLGLVGLVGSGDAIVLALAAVLVLGGEMLLNGAAMAGPIVDALTR